MHTARARVHTHTHTWLPSKLPREDLRRSRLLDDSRETRFRRKGRLVKRSAGKAETAPVSGFSSPWTAGYVRPTVLSLSLSRSSFISPQPPSILRARLFLTSVFPRFTPVPLWSLSSSNPFFSVSLRFALHEHVRVGGRSLAEVVRSYRWKFPRLAISVRSANRLCCIRVRNSIWTTMIPEAWLSDTKDFPLFLFIPFFLFISNDIGSFRFVRHSFLSCPSWLIRATSRVDWNRADFRESFSFLYENIKRFNKNWSVK